MTKKKLPAEIVCYCKGVCYPNPGGLMAYGYAFYLPEGDLPFHTDKGSKSDKFESTNFRAYFYAVLLSLKALIDQGYSDKVIEIRTDLKGAINQIIDWIYLDSEPADFSLMYEQSDLLREIIQAKKQFRKVRFVWVDKASNTVATDLAMSALTTFSGEA